MKLIWTDLFKSINVIQDKTFIWGIKYSEFCRLLWVYGFKEFHSVKTKYKAEPSQLVELNFLLSCPYGLIFQSAEFGKQALKVSTKLP